MNKYEWMWKTLQQHKRGLVDNLSCKVNPTELQTQSLLWHGSTLEVMNYIEIREKTENNGVTAREQIFDSITAERARQDRKHPEFQPEFRMAVLSEETGEVGRALQNKDAANLREELVQVAAVAVRWLEALEGDNP